jgi:hypothetical protein
MLKDEIIEILDLLNKYNIPEESQRELFEKGLHFDFTYGDPDPSNKNQQLNIFGVGILLKTCLENNIRINVKKLLDEPWMFKDENLIKEVAMAQNRCKVKIKTLGK